MSWLHLFRPLYSGKVQCLLSRGVILPMSTLSSLFHTNIKCFKTFEPDYLDSFGHIPPKLPPINIQIKGYDYPILESYQRYIHNLVENMGVDVEESWATPCESVSVTTYIDGSSKVKDSFKLHKYERNVQVQNLRTVDLQILADLLRKTCPEGVQLSVHEHNEEHFEARFIPDPFITMLKSEMKQFEENRLKAIEEKVAKEAAKKNKML